MDVPNFSLLDGYPELSFPELFSFDGCPELSTELSFDGCPELFLVESQDDRQ
jgi:hypothetical protein